MVEVKSIHIPTIMELLLLGAKDGYVEISTIELAKRLGKSQQSASMHLSDLEDEGFLVRRMSGGRHSLKITKKGLATIAEMYSLLQRIFEGQEQVFEFEGEIFTGFGEGAYYMSIRGYRRQFMKRLGFDPYPGTLNIRLDSPKYRMLKRDLEKYTSIRVEGFEDENRTYGGAKCYHAKIEGALNGTVIMLERTNYDDSVIEMIAPYNIREKLKLNDGDRISLIVYPLQKGPQLS